MGQIVATFPREPELITTVTLGETQYRLNLVWRHRTQGWYLSIYKLDGTAILLGRRLSASWSPTLGIDLPDGPTGHLYVRGTDGYLREDLGKALKLIRYSDEEIAAARAASTTFVPTVRLV